MGTIGLWVLPTAEWVEELEVVIVTVGSFVQID